MTPTITPPTLKDWLHDGHEIALLDVREHGQYGESHLFYAIPLPYSRIELDAPRLVPRLHTRTVVYDDASEGVAERAAARLVAIGYRNVSVLAGGTPAWAAAGEVLFAGVNLPSKTFGELAEGVYHTPRVSADELAAMLAGDHPPVVLDGRPVSEFHKMNIPTAICCPNGELPLRVQSLLPDDSTPVVINCAGRTRSIIGAQTLINLGLPNPVYALENGTQGWFLADHPLEHGGTRRYGPGSAGTGLKDGARRLARRFAVAEVDADTVREWAADENRNLFLCDVRTPEEFAAGSLPGAQHTPGGQLMQAGDQFFGVRGARLVLIDDDGIRAPTVASWLRQMGHDASVLKNGLNSGLALSTVVRPEPPPLAGITVAQLEQYRETFEVVDLRAGMAFRAGHLPGSRWAIRPRLARSLEGVSRRVVLVCDDPALAAWTVASEWPATSPAPLLLEGGFAAWRDGGRPLEASPDVPAAADCIDYLFFVHDRHDGNKEAARRYIQWETGLAAQLDARELAAFRLPVGEAAAPPSLSGTDMQAA